MSGGLPRTSQKNKVGMQWEENMPFSLLHLSHAVVLSPVVCDKGGCCLDNLLRDRVGPGVIVYAEVLVSLKLEIYSLFTQNEEQYPNTKGLTL